MLLIKTIIQNTDLLFLTGSLPLISYVMNEIGTRKTEASVSRSGCSGGGTKETSRGNRSKDDWRRAGDR